MNDSTASLITDPHILTMYYLQNHSQAHAVYELEEQFLASLLSRDPALSERDWLFKTLASHLPEFSAAEINVMADEILGSFEAYTHNLQQARQGVEQGLTPLQWLQRQPCALSHVDNAATAGLLPYLTADEGFAGYGHAELPAQKSGGHFRLLRSYAQGLRLSARTLRSRLAPGRLLTRKALDKGLDSGIKAALAAALQVALKRGLIRSPVPLGSNTLGIIAMMSVEHAKVGCRLARGKITRAEALDSMGVISTAGLATAITSSAGTAIGVALGAVFPVGGQFIGGMVGGIAGELLGQRYGEPIALKMRDLLGAAMGKLWGAATQLTRSMNIMSMERHSSSASGDSPRSD